MHIESSMTVPQEFSRAALPFGTCTVVADPHEIANVFGIEGIRRFMDIKTDMDIYWGIPSSVPSTNAALETTGGNIGTQEIRELGADQRVLCLGEVMNAKELCRDGESPAKAIVAAFKQERPQCPVEGHCPRISGAELSAFISAGVWSDHTLQTPASILEKTDKGMFLEIQRRSLTKENIDAIAAHGVYEHMALVTDDVPPDDLTKGHLNLLVQKAVELGMPVEEALYCATYSPSRHIGLRDRGAIAPGRIADFILLRDLNSFEIAAVYKRGKKVPAYFGAAGGVSEEAQANSRPQAFPQYFYTSVKRQPLSPQDFTPPLPPHFTGEKITCVSIVPDKTSTLTSRGSISCRVTGANNGAGILRWQETGCSLLAVIERYGRQAPLSFALVDWKLSKKGAIASSWAHDAHNILVLGNSEEDMALAANRIIALQGGFAVSKENSITAEAPLPVGGIVSDAPISELAAAIKAVREAMIDLGYKRWNEIMSFGTLPLLVSPEIKLGDKGLVDVKQQKIIGFYETGIRSTIDQ
jgi:adenine deaminase